MLKSLFILWLSVFIGIILLIPTEALAQITYPQFQSVVSVFHRIYDAELAKQNAVLVINSGATEQSKDIWWNLLDRHASYSSYLEPNGPRQHFLFMFGGYAQYTGMTIEGVAMTLCHEMGHGIGGTPYKDNMEDFLVSVEGQADYFAARYCIKRILSHIVPSQPIRALSPWVATQCDHNFSNLNQKQMCWRSFQVLENERLFFRTQTGRETETEYETPDTSVVDKTELDPYYYPTAQCRLDTMVAGILEKPRPRCWWKPAP